MNYDSMETPMDQSEGPSHPNPHQDYKISNSNDSYFDSIENLNRTDAESKQIVLITLVSQEPAIYNSKHEDYRNLPKKDELWLAMSQQVEWSDSYCKNKWKAIRDQYCRELKRTRKNSNVKIKWKYFKYLDFLKPYALARNYRTKNKLENNPDDEIDDQEGSSNTQEEATKTEFPTTEEITIKTEDWAVCERTDLLNENGDITSEIIMQLSQHFTKQDVKHEEELQCEQYEIPDDDDDDDDDDPIHTFLNIESYFEKELITLVQQKSMLYDIAHLSYRNTRLKSKIWEQIAKKLKKPVRQCRSKWKALRDQYIREHKRLKRLDKSVPRWKHYDAMNFLEKFIKERVEYNILPTEESPKTQHSNTILEYEDMIDLQSKSGSENNDIEPYSLMGDDENSVLCTEGLQTPNKSPEHKHTPEFNQEDKPNHLLIETVTEVTEAQSSSNDEIDDEVGSFFRALAMKIRKANMSPVAFTELQIDILKVITNALKD